MKQQLHSGPMYFDFLKQTAIGWVSMSLFLIYVVVDRNFYGNKKKKKYLQLAFRIKTIKRCLFSINSIVGEYSEFGTFKTKCYAVNLINLTADSELSRPTDNCKTSRQPQ